MTDSVCVAGSVKKNRTNEQGSLDVEHSGRFGFMSGGVRDVEVLLSVAAGSVSEVR